MSYRALILSLISLALGFTLKSYAQASSIKAKSPIIKDLDTDDEKGFSLKLDLLGTAYVSDPIDNENQVNQYGDFLPQLKWTGDSFDVDIRGVYGLNEEGDQHVYFPELWKSFGPISVGRKTQTWSELDKNHSLGLWQPLFRWDHARPVQMGLTGFFLQKKINPYVKLTGFASPLFLPDQQPDYRIEDGQMVSGNRWVRNPLTSIEFLGSPSRLNYRVKKPNVSDIVLNDSYALKLELGKEKGSWISTGWANKPMNQFHLGVDINATYDDATDTFYPDIYPYVVQHELFNGEIGYRHESFSIYFSVTEERFQKPEIPSEYLQTPLIDNRYFGAGLEHNISLPFKGKNRLLWSYIHRSLLSEEDANTYIEGEVSASTERLKFRTWFGVDYIYSSAGAYLEDVEMKLGYRYSPEDKADWIALNMDYGFTKSASIYAQADVFGSENKGEASFISYYTNNDRVQLGVKYVF